MDPVAPATTDRQALLRIAGWAAIVSGAAYAFQPLIVMLAAPPGAESDYPDVAELGAQRWQAPLEALIFVAVGGGLLVTVLALHRLIRANGTGVAVQLGTLGGVVSALGWLLLAGAGLGASSSVGMSLAEAAPDVAMQRAVIQGGSMISWGMVSTAALGLLAWLVMLARTGRRSELIGRPLTVVLWIAVVVIVVPLLVWSQAGGVLIMIPLLPVLGIRMLTRTREAVPAEQVAVK